MTVSTPDIQALREKAHRNADGLDHKAGHPTVEGALLRDLAAALSALSGETETEWGFRVLASGLVWPGSNEADARHYCDADPSVFELVKRNHGPWEVTK